MSTNLPAAILLAALLAVGGCRRPTPQAEAQQQLASYSALRLTLQSHHRPLQDEIARVKASQGLPQQIDASRGIELQSSGRASSLVDQLSVVFTPHRLKFARERSDKLFVEEVARWNPLLLEQAIVFRAGYEAEHQQLRKLLAAPGIRLQLPMTAGLSLSGSFADATLVYARFEAIAAADAIARGDAAMALQCIAQSLRVAELLSQEPQVVARLTAAEARRDTLGLVQRLVNSRIVTAAHLAQLERLISNQLAVWPHDSYAWNGDRTLGLCTFESIRQGQILSILTEAELVEVRRGEGLEVFAAAVAKSVDFDETRYLQAMRDVIAACDKPYYQRRAALEQWERQRAALLHTPEYPIVADRYLLAGVANAQRQQAADLAITRAWSMALAIACGTSLPPPEANPLTGESYDVQATSERVIVANIDPQQAELQVVVPLPTAQVEAARPRFPAVNSR